MSRALSPTQQRVLRALAGGQRLKSHRYLSGRKVFQLHPLDGPPLPIRRATVEALARLGLIDSNKKFPAAAYWLTERGRRAVGARIDAPPR
jgi:uncharacterized protein YjhX (UPF0386 family)